MFSAVVGDRKSIRPSNLLPRGITDAKVLVCPDRMHRSGINGESSK